MNPLGKWNVIEESLTEKINRQFVEELKGPTQRASVLCWSQTPGLKVRVRTTMACSLGVCHSIFVTKINHSKCILNTLSNFDSLLDILANRNEFDETWPRLIMSSLSQVGMKYIFAQYAKCSIQLTTWPILGLTPQKILHKGQWLFNRVLMWIGTCWKVYEEGDYAVNSADSSYLRIALGGFNRKIYSNLVLAFKLSRQSPSSLSKRTQQLAHLRLLIMNIILIKQKSHLSIFVLYLKRAALVCIGIKRCLRALGYYRNKHKIKIRSAGIFLIFISHEASSFDFQWRSIYLG